MTGNGSEWVERCLHQLAEIASGESIPEDMRTGDFPLMGANGVIGAAPRPNFGPGYLVGRVGAAGAVNLVPRQCWASDNTLTVLPRPECDFSFLGHLLRFLRPEQLATKNAQPLVTQTNLGNLRVLVPIHQPEQRCIAEILDTLDAAICKAEQLIIKLKQVKQGLLHDLLSLGIDDNGEIRDSTRYPERFKDSPLGRFPREWKICALEDCVSPDAIITYGIVQAGPHVPDGVPYIRTGDMSSGKLLLDGLLRTSHRIAANYGRSRVQAGEIVCAIRATVGNVLLVPAELDGANLTQGTARIAPRRELNSAFLLWALRGEVAQRQFKLSIKGTTFQEITLAQLRRLFVPVPVNRAEQDRIASAMTSIELREECEGAELTKLRLVKQGLMEDLLTGRVRVPRLFMERVA